MHELGEVLHIGNRSQRQYAVSEIENVSRSAVRQPEYIFRALLHLIP
jgi:hypothetical protein